MSTLMEIKSRIQSTDALIAEHRKAAAAQGPDAPRSLMANIRSLEKLKRKLESDYHEAAGRVELERAG
jgi:division protein CdvB (Snf7/Vps24/ESCRT-III family)